MCRCLTCMDCHCVDNRASSLRRCVRLSVPRSCTRTSRPSVCTTAPSSKICSVHHTSLCMYLTCLSLSLSLCLSVVCDLSLVSIYVIIGVSSGFKRAAISHFRAALALRADYLPAIVCLMIPLDFFLFFSFPFYLLNITLCCHHCLSILC